MKLDSFMLRMGSDWDFQKKQKSIKRKVVANDDWHWFFGDIDKDGVLNGVDCKPYDKHKQDTGSYLKVNTSRYIAPQMSVSKYRAALSAIATKNAAPIVSVAKTTTPTPAQTRVNLANAIRSRAPGAIAQAKAYVSNSAIQKTTAVPIQVSARPVATQANVSQSLAKTNYMSVRPTTISAAIQANKRVMINSQQQKNVVSQTRLDQITKNVNTTNTSVSYGYGTKTQHPQTTNTSDIAYSDNNLPYNKNMLREEGKYVSPDGQEYNSIHTNYYDGNRHLGYDAKIYPTDLSPKRYGLYDSGINRENVSAMSRVDRAGYISNPSETYNVGEKAKEYLKAKNITIKRPDTKNVNGMFGSIAGGTMNPITNEMTLGNNSGPSTLLHETSHAQDFGNPIRYVTDTVGITPGFKSGMDRYNAGKLKNLDEGPYVFIPKPLLGTEAKAYEVSQYYDGIIPRNESVNAFERELGVTSNYNPQPTLSDITRAGNVYQEIGQNIFNERKKKGVV